MLNTVKKKILGTRNELMNIYKPKPKAIPWEVSCCTRRVKRTREGPGPRAECLPRASAWSLVGRYMHPTQRLLLGTQE